MRRLLEELNGLDELYSARTALNEEQLTARNPLYWLAHVGAHLGDTVLWVLVTLFLWRRARDNQHRQRSLIGWTISFAAGAVGTMLVKQAVRRPRPGSGRFLYGVGPDEHSFPSGHGVRCGVILTWASALWPGAGKLAPLLILWIGWARIALNIHYIGDVVAGLVLGAGLSQIVRWRALGRCRK